MAGTDAASDLHGYNGGELVATCALFLTLTWISVGLRTYTRRFLTHCFQADDWLMLVSLGIFTLSCSFILAGCAVGMGHHNADITNDEDKVAALKWQALATATYVLDMMFIKLSIGVFLLRVSVQMVYRYIIWASLVVITIWSTVIFIWDIFQCSPVTKQWDYRIKGGHCVSAAQIVSAAYAITAMTIVSDWLYALLPIPMLWNVQMTKQAKATVIVILGLGIFASIATLVRIKYLNGLEDTADILYAGTDAMVWTLVEPGVAIVASSLATIRPLLRAMRIRGFESSDHTGRSGTSRSGGGAATKRGTAGGSMPGYGLDDVTLNDFRGGVVGGGAAGGDEGKSDFAVRSMRATVERHHDSDEWPRQGRHVDESASEVYVIEGATTQRPTWSGRGSGSPNSSLDQIHGLEAQSQDVRPGLSTSRQD